MRPAGVFGFTVAAALGVSAAAGADETRAARARLVWEAPPECESATELTASVAKVAGREVFAMEPPWDYVVRGTVVAEGQDWVARFRLENDASGLVGERELRRSSRSCRTLDVPLAVTLALMLDLQATLPSPPPKPVPPARVVYRLPAPAKTWDVEGEASATGAAGLFPNVALGARLDLGVRFSRVRIGATATLWPLATNAEPDGAGVAMQAWHAGLLACAALIQRRGWLLDACLSGQAGILTATGSGFAYVQTQAPVLVVGGGELVLRALQLGPLRFGIGAGALVPLGRYRFYATPAGGDRNVDVTWPVIPVIRLDLGLVSERD